MVALRVYLQQSMVHSPVLLLLVFGTWTLSAVCSCLWLQGISLLLVHSWPSTGGLGIAELAVQVLLTLQYSCFQLHAKSGKSIVTMFPVTCAMGHVSVILEIIAGPISSSRSTGSPSSLYRVSYTHTKLPHARSSAQGSTAPCACNLCISCKPPINGQRTL